MTEDYVYPINLRHTPPTFEEAREWASNNPGTPSAFGAKYPGRYAEAVEMLKIVLKQVETNL